MKFIERNSGTRLIREDEATVPSDTNIIDTIKDPAKLTYHMVGASVGRKKEMRYQSLRLSEIDKACPREYVLGKLMNLSFWSSVRFSNLWQMDMGSVLHWFLQNEPRYFGDKLVGWWQCRACGYERRFGVRPTEPCEQCKAHPRVTEYKEYMFRLKKPYSVVGKIDLILRVAPRIYRYGEIKTCSEDKDTPDGDHVAQTASYTYFSRYDDKLPITIDRSTCYIFYFNKKFNWKTPTKVFTIKPTAALINPLKEKAGLITTCIENKTLPDALMTCVHNNFAKGRAKQCGIAAECKKQFEMGTTVLG
jgi:hypothetical protein